MKHTPLMKLLAVGAVSALALSTSFAQAVKETTTTVGTNGAGVSATTTTGTTGVSSSSTTTSSSTLDGTGTITTYSPGQDYLEMRTETTQSPVKYYYTKNTTIVDPTGATVAFSALQPDMPVRYTYVKEGDRMVVSKITLVKPVTEYTKETTTTTTTTDK